MKLIKYMEVKLICTDEFKEILIAELNALDFDSMMETEEGLDAYQLINDFDKKTLESLVARYPDAQITYSTSEFENKNWNEEWEKNYDPIIVEDKCLVRATFHKDLGDFEYEIVINPKMSFGTGHHSTTYLMLKNQMQIDHKAKRVLDAGCGTAILAIMAEKLGAKEIVAYDIDEWCIENAPENVALNHCKNITVLGGTINSIELKGEFDIILANINKNILLEEMNEYAHVLTDQGQLILSGFYTTDDKDIIEKAAEFGLNHLRSSNKNDWSSLIFVKN